MAAATEPPSLATLSADAVHHLAGFLDARTLGRLAVAVPRFGRRPSGADGDEAAAAGDDGKSALAVGATVLVHGLGGAPQHNGSAATVLRYVEQKQRYQVHVDRLRKPLSVRRQNLALADTDGAGARAGAGADEADEADAALALADALACRAVRAHPCRAAVPRRGREPWLRLLHELELLDAPLALTAHGPNVYVSQARWR